MIDQVITAALLLVSAIHILPIAGYLSASKLSTLYSIDVGDPNLEILMRHRSMLFGILAALFAYAAFQPNLQPLAFAAGFISVLSFFHLSYTVGGFNNAIKKVVIADVVALIALTIAACLFLYQKVS